MKNEEIMKWSRKNRIERCWSGEKKVVSVKGKRATTKQAQLDCMEEVEVFSQFCKKKETATSFLVKTAWSLKLIEVYDLSLNECFAVHKDYGVQCGVKGVRTSKLKLH